MSDRRRVQARIREAVAALAIAIDQGDVDPTLEELQALTTLCDRQQLPDEAERVRRWYLQAWTSGRDRRPS
jgi:hypothetical protein